MDFESEWPPKGSLLEKKALGRIEPPAGGSSFQAA